MPKAKTKQNSFKTYKSKRDFSKTLEPATTTKPSGEALIFVVQKHYASHLHYDFRIEIDGVLVSWAVPKGPPERVGVKHLAIQTENHPLDYANFEGEIPKGQYGAGKVLIWDRGTFYNLKRDKEGQEIPLHKCLKQGAVEIDLLGKKLKGRYALIHLKEKEWLFIKMKKPANDV
jgi:bifunctional non-homologous end joining protein LigD